jgi:hypothetical protein
MEEVCWAEVREIGNLVESVSSQEAEGGTMTSYVSLEMAKRLAEAGIVMETTKNYYCFWNGLETYFVLSFNNIPEYPGFPAPSMSELWDVMPFQTYIEKMDDGTTLVWGAYEKDNVYSKQIFNTNPADALAELAIWLKERKDDR